jgi:radical SAM superfamily enzyme YgiQ (UPF0313 family)
MQKVLFSHTYLYQYDSKQWKLAEPFPPLMTIIAAAYLRDNGYEVALFDVGLRNSEKGLEEILEQFQPDFFVVFDDGFNWLTKMCLTTMREAAFRMQKMAKAKEITVITCSSDSTDQYEKYLENGADVVIKGEGEMTLLHLINTMTEENTIANIEGIAYKTGDEIAIAPKRPVMVNLDQLPPPAWDLINIGQYRAIWESHNKAFCLNIATTRGCPYKCNWCAKPIYGQRYNTRSPVLVVNEIENHVQQHQVDHFWMCDDIFGLKPGWVKEFRDELLRRNLKIKFKIQSRADLLLKEQNIESLVDAGLDEAWIGAESGSQKILDAMDKGITIEQIRTSTTLLKQKGVKVGFFIQYGYLGETKEDIKLTIKMIRRLIPDSLGISVSYPLPGTKFYEKVKSDLSKKTNWIDSDDLDMMFKNTYQPDFYRALHKYTHFVYHIEKGIRSAKHILSSPQNTTFNKFKEVLKAVYFTPMALFKTIQLKWLA